MSKPQSSKGKRSKGTSEQQSLSQQYYNQLLQSQPPDSYIVSEDIINHLLSNLERRIQYKLIEKKCKPYAVESVQDLMGSIVHITYINYDKKKDDKYLEDDDIEEPISYASDPMRPNMANVNQKIITVLEEEQEPSLFDINEKFSDKKSLKSSIRIVRSRKTSAIKTKAAIPVSLNPIDELRLDDDDLRKDSIQEIIETQRKRIEKRDTEQKKKMKELLKKKKKQNATDVLSVEMGDSIKIKGNQSYHIEDNGQIILVKKPAVDRLPKQFITPLQADLNQPVELLHESEFNKQVKYQKQHSLLKDKSLDEIELDMQKQQQQAMKQNSHTVDTHFTNIMKNFKPKKGVNYVSAQGNHESGTDKSSQRHESQGSIRKSQEVFYKPGAKQQFSIHEYRERFDYENIALSKFEEIKKVKTELYSQSNSQGQYQNPNTYTFIGESMFDSKIISKEETIMDDFPQETDRATLHPNFGETMKFHQVHFENTSHSYLQDSKVSSTKNGSITIKLNPSILIEENQNLRYGGITQKVMLPNLIAQTPHTAFSQTVSRRNSLVSHQQKSDLNQSKIIDYGLLKESKEASQFPSISKTSIHNKLNMSHASAMAAKSERPSMNRTANNSPMGSQMMRDDLKQFLSNKAQPRKVLDKIKQKMKKEDEKLSIGRIGAFGEITSNKVKPLKNEHLRITARNMLNLKQYHQENSLVSERKLPPPQLGKTMGHGILNLTLSSISHTNLND